METAEVGGQSHCHWWIKHPSGFWPCASSSVDRGRVGPCPWLDPIWVNLVLKRVVFEEGSFCKVRRVSVACSWVLRRGVLVQAVAFDSQSISDGCLPCRNDAQDDKWNAGNTTRTWTSKWWMTMGKQSLFLEPAGHLPSRPLPWLGRQRYSLGIGVLASAAQSFGPTWQGCSVILC